MKKFKRNLYLNKRKKKKKKKRKLTVKEQILLRQWSLTVRERDSFTCRSCGSTKNTHAHHMISKYYVPKYKFYIENGITLCKSCHVGINGVHGKGTAKNKFILKLKRIYKKRCIKDAIKMNVKN